MSIEIPHVQPGALIKASFVNELIDAIEQLDARLEKVEKGPGPPDTGGVVVDSVTPPTAREGDPVTIKGKNFGASKGASMVTFDGEPPALITAWTDEEIVCIVPDLGVSEGGESVFVKVDNFLTDDGRSITVLPRVVLPVGSLAVTDEDVSPDPITAGTDNDFKFTLRSDASLPLKATITPKVIGQTWTAVVLNDSKQPITDRQIPIVPDASKTFFVRVSIPSGTNQAPFKLETTATGPTGVRAGTTTPLDYVVGQFGDPDKTFTMVPSTSSPSDALSGSSIKASASGITEIHFTGEFTVAGKYEVTLQPVPSLSGWDAVIESPQKDSEGKHVIEITQQQIDGEADHSVSRSAQLNVAPDTAGSQAIQLRFAVKRAGAQKARTFTFDVQATN